MIITSVFTRLLEELELLSKVWRRRVDHPYTAHIESAGKLLSLARKVEFN